MEQRAGAVMTDMKQPNRNPLTDAEIEWLARLLVLLAEQPETRRCIRLLALGFKVGLMESNDWRYHQIRHVVGLPSCGLTEW